MKRRGVRKDLIISALRDLRRFVGPHPDLAFLNPQCAEYQRIDNYQVDASPDIIERLTVILRDAPILQCFEDTTLQSNPGSERFLDLGQRRTLLESSVYLIAVTPSC